MKVRIMIQKCMICDYKAIWKVVTKKDEDRIRASCLACGHQGMFTLEEEK